MSKGFVPPRALKPATIALIRRTLGASPQATQPKQPMLPMLGVGAVAVASKLAGRTRGAGASAVIFPDEVVVVDTETTGTSRTARLVEIGAVRVRNGAVVASFETLVHPEMRIPSDAMAVHRITDSMVAKAPRAGDALRDFLAFVGGSHLVAHNAAFDRRIFEQELARTRLPSPGLPVWCTMKLSKGVFPGMSGYSLGALASVLSIRQSGAHRAMVDVLTTVELLKRCLAQRQRDALGALHGPPKTL